MARRKVSRRKSATRRKSPARRKTTRRKTTTRRRKSPARRKTTRRKTTTRRRKSPARRKTTSRRKAPARRKTTRRRKSPARRKTTTRRKSPARRKTTRRRKSPARRKTTSRRKSPARRRTARRKSVSRRRTVRAGKGFLGKAMKYTRDNLMRLETMAALGAGIYLSATLPGMAQRAFSRVGLNLDLTSGYRAPLVSIGLAGLGGYALKSMTGLSNEVAGAFTVAAMLPAVLSLANQFGLSMVPTIHASGGGLSGFRGIGGFLGNAPTVIEEPMFGGYHEGMHAPVASGEMFGLAGREINLF
jgi:hypothetical protein